MRRLGRRGAALLETMVALAILSTAGVAAVTMVAESTRAVDSAREADAEMREADAFFHAVSLWTRDDLDRRLGDREQGPWRLQIHRTDPELYEVTLTDAARSRVLLHTTLYRPRVRRGVD